MLRRASQASRILWRTVKQVIADVANVTDGEEDALGGCDLIRGPGAWPSREQMRSGVA